MVDLDGPEQAELDALASAPLPMCEAVPKAALKPWSPVRTCASRSSALIFDSTGVGHYICGMHVAAWEHGDHDALALRWGWR